MRCCFCRLVSHLHPHIHIAAFAVFSGVWPRSVDAEELLARSATAYRVSMSSTLRASMNLTLLDVFRIYREADSRAVSDHRVASAGVLFSHTVPDFPLLSALLLRPTELITCLLVGCNSPNSQISSDFPSACINCTHFSNNSPLQFSTTSLPPIAIGYSICSTAQRSFLQLLI